MKSLPRILVLPRICRYLWVGFSLYYSFLDDVNACVPLLFRDGLFFVSVLLPTNHCQWKWSILVKELNYHVLILDGTAVPHCAKACLHFIWTLFFALRPLTAKLLTKSTTKLCLTLSNLFSIIQLDYSFGLCLEVSLQLFGPKLEIRVETLRQKKEQRKITTFIYNRGVFVCAQKGKGAILNSAFQGETFHVLSNLDHTSVYF